MARKNKKISTNNNIQSNTLPQNIISIGERVFEDKNVYINQNVYKTIHRFTKDKKTNESGGILVGDVIEEFGKVNIIIIGFIEAKYCEATPTTLKLTHETWEYCHSQIDKKYRGKKIVGWIHTHPDFGIFLSEYDKFIQNNFFSELWQIAYVIDPIQNEEGFYFWVRGSIEKCTGFYVFDKTGRKIDIESIVDSKDEKVNGRSRNWTHNIITTILAALVIIMFLLIINMNKQINNLNKELNFLEQNIIVIPQGTIDSNLGKVQQNDGEKNSAESPSTITNGSNTNNSSQETNSNNSEQKK